MIVQVKVNLLDEARELLTLGYPTASAVSARAALEVGLRAACNSKGCKVGRKCKIAHSLGELRRYDHLSKADAKLIWDAADLGGQAAHAGVDDDEAAKMLGLVSTVLELLGVEDSGGSH